MLELFLMAALWMGGEPICPHNSVKPEPAKATPIFLVECGGGVTTVGGMTTQGCPLVVLVQPAHDRTVHTPGSNTYTEVQAVYPVKRLDYACETISVLWILPIGSVCVLKGESTSGAVTHYVQRNCPVKEPPVEKTS